MPDLLTSFLALYLALWFVTLVINRRSSLESTLGARVRSELPKELVLDPPSWRTRESGQSSAAEGASGHTRRDEARFVVAFGWACAKARRSGEDVKHLLIVCFDKLERRPHLASGHVRADI